MSGRRRDGFTLAEVAVTIVIVGMALVVLMQGLNTAKMTAAHTRNSKLASELARLTVGRVSAGLFQEDLDSNEYLDGTYADDGYPEFSWEILLGDETFPDAEEDEDEFRDRFDTFAWDDEDDDDDDEDADEPYEKVSVRVHFPAMREFENNLTLVQWIPWDQVYGSDEDEEEARR